MHIRLSLSLLLVGSALAVAAEKSPTAAPAKEKSGATGSSYQWLEEPKAPETGAWLTHRIVAAQANDQPEIAKGLTELLRAESVAVPCAQNGVFFFTKRGRGEKQASIYRRKGLEGTDERVFDTAKLGAKNAALTILGLSADGSLLVYGVSEGKAAERTVRFFDVKAGRDLEDVLPRARYNTVTVSPDKKGAWYAKVEPAGTRIFFHSFGTETSADKFIFGETYYYEPLGPKDLISTELTNNGRYLLLSVRRGEQAKRVDVYAQEQHRPDRKVRRVIHAMDHHFSWVSHGGDLFVLTDHEAPKQRVVKVVIDDPAPLQWQVIVPEGEDALTGIEIVNDKLFVTGVHAGAAQTRIFTLEGKEMGQVISPKAELAQRVHHVCAHE